MDSKTLELLRRDSKISIDREGRWHHDGALVENPKVAALFDRGIGRAAGGEPTLTVGSQWCYIDVADTLFVVRELIGAPDPHALPRLRLNDGLVETVDPLTLAFRGERDLYCRVKVGTELARFSRHATNAIAGMIDIGDDGVPFLRCGDRSFPIGVQ